MIKFLFNVDYRIRRLIKWLISLENENKYWFLTNIIRRNLERSRYIVIGSKCKLGKNLSLPHPHNIIIGRDCVIGNNCKIYQDVTLGQNLGMFPIVKDNVIIYAGAKIIGNVTIGNYAIVGANAVVTHNVPDNAIVGGIPAKVLGYRSEKDLYY